MPKKKYNNYDNTLFGRYIRQIENPDSIGWDSSSRIWRQSTRKGDDERNRGMGIDVLNNKAAKKLTQDRVGGFLTEEEERQLRNEYLQEMLNVVDRQKAKHPGLNNMSPRKQAEVIGALYRGDAPKLWDKSTILGKALESPNEEDFHRAIDTYYNSVGLGERARNNDKFWSNQTHSNQSPHVPSPTITRQIDGMVFPTMSSSQPTITKQDVVDAAMLGPKAVAASVGTVANYINQAVQKYIKPKDNSKDNTVRWAEGGFLKPKDAWDALSMKDKADMIGIAVKHGITTLSDIRDKYNEFAEGGDTEEPWTMQDEANYRQWRGSLPENLRDTNDDDYDMRGAFKAGMQPILESDGKYHLQSRDPKTGRILKAPHHPSFLQAIATDASMGYYPLTDNKGQTYTQTWRGNEYSFGGPLIEGAMNEYRDGGGIHIAPSKKGTFTAAAKKHGKSVQAFASQVLAHPENYSPAMRKKANFARNARHWKHGLGGNLFDGTSEDTQQMQIGRPYYSYDWNGNRITDASGNPILNYNITLPEVTIIPDSRLSPAERNYRERQRQKTFVDYAEQNSQDYTTRQSITAQREWENSPQKKALDFGIAAAQGIGMASDVVSPFFGGIPVYSGLKGAQALDRATSTNKIADYADAALWLSPMLTVAGKKVYDAAKPIVQRAFQKGTPAAEWAEGPQFSIGNGMIPNGVSEDIKPAIERGRNTLIDWLESSFYKDRLKDEPLYRVADDVVADVSAMVRDVPVAVKERSLLEDFANGTTSPRPFTEKVLPDGTIIRDFNTGLDVAVASDLGENADDVTLHELLHYMTSNSKGTPIPKAGEKIIEHGWFAPTDAYYNAIGIINRTRGKRWQNYVMDQNNALLPKYDAVVKMVIEEPSEAKAALIRTGRTAEQAEAAVNSLRERYSYWYDIQEQRAHLQELFLSKIKPHLKNSNDAAEIETFLTEHPDILENSLPYKYIQEVRPGSLKQYAGYFASALGTVPFILNSGSNE